MAYNVVTGEIVQGRKYLVVGTQSVIYNGNTITTGNKFTGVSGVATFTYTGSGTQEVNEVLEAYGSGIELVGNELDEPVTFPESTNLLGFGAELTQTPKDAIFNDMTIIMGFGIEFEVNDDYIVQIVERRL